MPLPSFGLFFDVENETAGWFQDPEKLFTAGQKPLDIFFGFDAAVSFVALVGVWRRRDDEIKGALFKLLQHFPAVALNNVCCDWQSH